MSFFILCFCVIGMIFEAKFDIKENEISVFSAYLYKFNFRVCLCLYCSLRPDFAGLWLLQQKLVLMMKISGNFSNDFIFFILDFIHEVYTF